MKKIYRRSQITKVLGCWIGGFEMHKYGMPYRNAGGHIFPRDVDLVERMLDAVEKHPEIHVVTSLRNGWTVNRYETENVIAYSLYTGNADPDIEINDEFLESDFTEEEIAAFEKRNQESCDRELTPVEIAAVNFALNAVINGNRD